MMKLIYVIGAFAIVAVICGFFQGRPLEHRVELCGPKEHARLIDSGKDADGNVTAIIVCLNLNEDFK